MPIFLSYASPYNEYQMIFINRIIQELKDILLFPRTLGVTDQETEVPLTTIKQLILSSYGLIGVVFRRVFIEEAISRPGTHREVVYKNQWLSSPYLQVEPAMAYQQGLPLMLIVEEGVITDGVFGGILEQGATPLYIPRFTLKSEKTINEFFNSVLWKPVFLDWVGEVRTYYQSLTSNVVLPGGTV